MKERKEVELVHKTHRTLLLENAVFGFVEMGHADVYYVRHTDGRKLGRRRHLRRLSAGEAFFGKTSEQGSGSLLLNCSRAATISGVGSFDSLHRAKGEGAFIVAVEAWVQMLLDAIYKGRPPQEANTPEVGAHVHLVPGAALMSDGALLWITQLSGCSYVCGRRSRLAEIRSGSTTALSRHAWLVARDPSEVICQSTTGLLEAGVLQDALDELLGHSLVLIHQDETERDKLDLRLAIAREQADAEEMHRACRELGSVLAPANEGSETTDALEAALSVAAKHEGIVLKSEPFPNQRRVRDRLSSLARTSGFSMRRVVLRGEWWRKDAGAMVGATAPDDGQSPAPIALRWKRSRGYWAYDPASGNEWRVGARTASSISAFAYALYRPLRTSRVSFLSFLRFSVKGSGRDLMTIVVLGVVAGALAALTPILTAIIFDHAIPEADRSQLMQVMALLVMVAVLAGLLQFVRGVAVLRIETRLDARAQAAIWDRLLSLPASFFRKYTAGDLAVRAGGVTLIRQVVSASFTSLLLTGIFACWYVALLFYYSAASARWVLGSLGAATIVCVFLAALQLKYLRRATDVQTKLSGTVLQLITGISKLRVARAEKRAYVQWARRFAEQRRLYVTGRRHANGLLAFQSILPILLMMLVYGLVPLQKDGEITTGEFLAFHSALLALGGTTALITSAFTAAASAAPYYEQLRPILESAPENDISKPSPAELEGDIELRHVTFQYGSDGPPVLDDVSLRVKPGEFVAIVGPSGCGKSTLLRLLVGFEQPGSGTIYFDGQEAAGLNSQALRRQIGVVLQDGGMLTGDVFSNIVGSSGASMDEAWEAAKMAGLEADIRQMPMGMHTVINEGGTTISGGQRQRLKVARAIVARPRILLFDEATSALDNVTQSIVSRSLSSLNATRIVIAHRLSTIVHADRIFVLDRGRIVQEGSYDTLMRQPGLFRDLASRQVV